MRVALLSAGKTLRLYDPSAARYDCRVGVNTAAVEYECDWWSVGDHRPCALLPAIGKDRLRLFTMRAELDAAETIGASIDRSRVKYWDELNATCAVQNWSEFSATAGLVLCAHLGARSIDCYGCDMVGKEDYRGDVCVADRPAVRDEENRWPKERAIWNAIVAWLQRDRRIAVERVGHASPFVEIVDRRVAS